MFNDVQLVCEERGKWGQSLCHHLFSASRSTSLFSISWEFFSPALHLPLNFSNFHRFSSFFLIFFFGTLEAQA